MTQSEGPFCWRCEFYGDDPDRHLTHIQDAIRALGPASEDESPTALLAMIDHMLSHYAGKLWILDGSVWMDDGVPSDT